ncbi:MAG: LysM peptidoglycan-binding domain-containing protein [Muribaculaceae bacterium]|nr:LysM peptidoglycan-binding domain-containing protein [Muribaculaceae bacterium]
MMKNLKKILLVFITLVISCSVTISAEKLSKKIIGNTEFYCYKVKTKETIFGIAKKFNVTQDELKQYNPSINNGLKKDFVLLLPVSLIDSRKNNNSTIQQSNPFVHIVKKGETLYGLSKTYGVSQEDIIANNPQVRAGLKLGQEIVIPQPSVKESANEQLNMEGNVLYHTIKQGETLYRLSKNYNISIENILKLNPGVSPENFKIGTVIKIVANAPKTEKRETTVTVMKSYIAETGDNLKKIAKRTGVDIDDLEDANPNVGKVKTGMTIQIPVAKTDSVDVVVSEGNEYELQHNDSERIKEIYDSIHYLNSSKSINVALMLPFMLNNSVETKQSKLYTEFYKGFLLALKDVNERYNDNEINVYTYDTEGTTDKLMSILSIDEVKEMDLIFAPDVLEQLDSISSFSKSNGIYVVNTFSVKDENYDNNPYMFQINIPQDNMYADVCDWISKDFKDYEVVFIHKKGNAKKDIADNLKGYLEQERRTVKEVEYSSVLTCEELLEVVNVNEKTLFIPTSGTKASLSQMIPALKKLKDENPMMESAVVGYPEWSVYMEDWKQDFHTINAHFYSRVFVDEKAKDFEKFNSEYLKWYGEDLIESTPCFGYLGYDTGKYFLSEMCKNGKDFNQNSSEYVGLQSSFEFDRINSWSGFVNQALYLVHFTSNDKIEITIK